MVIPETKMLVVSVDEDLFVIYGELRDPGLAI